MELTPKTMEKRRNNIFEGLFKILSAEECIDGQWVILDVEKDGRFFYEFFDAELKIDSKNRYSYRGNFIEYIGEKEIHTTYIYMIDGEVERLSIDCSLYDEGGVVEACFDDQYSIGVQSDGSIYLSLLNDPDELPPYFRVLIKRV